MDFLQSLGSKGINFCRVLGRATLFLLAMLCHRPRLIKSFPLLIQQLYSVGVLSLIIVAELLLIVFNEILLGPSNAYLKNLFSEQYRYRGASLSFCLGMSLIGGLTQVIENYFYRSTGSFGNIIWWLLIISLGTFASLKWVEFKNFSKDKREG